MRTSPVAPFGPQRTPATWAGVVLLLGVLLSVCATAVMITALLVGGPC